jgi:hypothetical protein
MHFCGKTWQKFEKFRKLISFAKEEEGGTAKAHKSIRRRQNKSIESFFEMYFPSMVMHFNI